MNNSHYDWFDLWLADRQSMASTMRKNMASDLKAGYDPMGISILSQYRGILEYEAETDHRLRGFCEMTTEMVNHWCYIDLRRRGAIA